MSPAIYWKSDIYVGYGFRSTGHKTDLRKKLVPRIRTAVSTGSPAPGSNPPRRPCAAPGLIAAGSRPGRHLSRDCTHWCRLRCAGLPGRRQGSHYDTDFKHFTMFL